MLTSSEKPNKSAQEREKNRVIPIRVSGILNLLNCYCKFWRALKQDCYLSGMFQSSIMWHSRIKMHLSI